MNNRIVTVSVSITRLPTTQCCLVLLRLVKDVDPVKQDA